MIFLLTLPFRLLGLGFKTGAGTAKLTHRSVRLLGYRRLFVFGAGVAVGMLFAPGPGAELRAKLKAKFDELQGLAPAIDLATRVRDELASAPRTWHLPQPTVEVVGEGRVALTGEVPDTAARADLERVAAAVKGVVTVENRLSTPA